MLVASHSFGLQFILLRHQSNKFHFPNMLLHIIFNVIASTIFTCCVWLFATERTRIQIPSCVCVFVTAANTNKMQKCLRLSLRTHGCSHFAPIFFRSLPCFDKAFLWEIRLNNCTTYVCVCVRISFTKYHFIVNVYFGECLCVLRVFSLSSTHTKKYGVRASLSRLLQLED